MKEASTAKVGRAHATCEQDGLAVRTVRVSSQEISWMMIGENAKRAAGSNREIRQRSEANAPSFFFFTRKIRHFTFAKMSCSTRTNPTQSSAEPVRKQQSEQPRGICEAEVKMPL